MDLIWIFLTSALIFMMQPGFALVELGLVTHRYVVNAMLKNLVHLAVALIGFGFVGFTILFSDGDTLQSLFISFDPSNFSIFKDSTVPIDGIRIFHIAFAAAAAAIISGAVAGRIRIGAYFLISLFMCTLLYPAAGRLIWGKGLLHQLGILDFAGGIVVHGVGGAAALACALALGPRIERQAPSGRLRELTGHNIVLTGLGVFTLWFAWFGFNCGSVLQFTENQALIFPIFMNTLAAAGVGLLVGLVFTHLRFGFVKPIAAIESLMAGLVAITAGCAYVELWAALIIAAVGALLVHVASALVLRWKIDDPVNAFAVHVFPGLWGAVAISLFASPAIVPSRFESLLVQFLGGSATILFSFGAMYAACRLIAATVGLRVDRETEVRGLDRAEHDYENQFFSEGSSHDARLRDQGRAIASLSHEILGSLGAAKVQAELLQMGLGADVGATAESTERLRERCAKSLDGLRRAERIARLTLGYSRAGVKINPSVNLAVAVNAAVEMVLATHVKQRVKIHLDVSDRVEAFADETRLVQAFYNILRNACEAFREEVKDRQIRIALSDDGGWCTLAFEDNAGGIADDVLDRLGEAFASGEPAKGGLGLGMNLTRQYLEQLGFELDVATKAGVGTKFLVRIPKTALLEKNPEGADERPDR